MKNTNIYFKTFLCMYYIYKMRIIFCTNNLRHDIHICKKVIKLPCDQNQQESQKLCSTTFQRNEICFSGTTDEQIKGLTRKSFFKEKNYIPKLSNKSISVLNTKNLHLSAEHDDGNVKSNLRASEATEKSSQSTCPSPTYEKTYTNKDKNSISTQDNIKFNNQQLEKFSINSQNHNQKQTFETTFSGRNNDPLFDEKNIDDDKSICPDLELIRLEIVDLLLYFASNPQLNCQNKHTTNHNETHKANKLVDSKLATNSSQNGTLKRKHDTSFLKHNIKSSTKFFDLSKIVYEEPSSEPPKNTQFQSNSSLHHYYPHTSTSKQTSKTIHDRIIYHSINGNGNNNKNQFKNEQNANLLKGQKFIPPMINGSGGINLETSNSLERHCEDNRLNIHSKIHLQKESMERSFQKFQPQNEVELFFQKQEGDDSEKKLIKINQDHSYNRFNYKDYSKQGKLSFDCSLKNRNDMKLENNLGNDETKETTKQTKILFYPSENLEVLLRGCKNIVYHGSIFSGLEYVAGCKRITADENFLSSVAIENDTVYKNSISNFDEIENLMKSIDYFSYAFVQLYSLKFLLQKNQVEICGKNEIFQILKSMLTDLKLELDEFRTIYYILYYMCCKIKSSNIFNQRGFNIAEISRLIRNNKYKKSMLFLYDLQERIMKIQMRIYNLLETLNKEENLQIITNEVFQIYTFFYNFYIQPTFKLHKYDELYEHKNFFIEFYIQNSLIDLDKTSIAYERCRLWFFRSVLSIIFDPRSTICINEFWNILILNRSLPITNITIEEFENSLKSFKMSNKNVKLLNKFFKDVSRDPSLKNESYETLIHCLF